MATDLTRDDIRKLARLGAARRLEELKQEESAIRAAFPDLDEGTARGSRRRRRRRGRPAASAAAASSGAATARKRKRPKMSAAQRKAVSARMRKYWAERRKGNG